MKRESARGAEVPPLRGPAAAPPGGVWERVVSRPEPDWRTLVALVWSVVRIAWAVVLTFWPVFSAATAARSAPSFAVLMASSALPIANWPNTPALSAEAPMFSRLPTPLRI